MSGMSTIRRSIQVRYDLRVDFTQDVFAPANIVLKAVLDSGGESPRKVLVVLDEALAQAQPELAAGIICYFDTHFDSLNLVCPPIIIEGGERTKNSYFHVSEIHSQIERYHI